MMTWLVAATRSVCLSCRANIPVGSKLLQVRHEGAAGAVATGAETIRCQTCGEQLSGEPAPDLPALPPRLPVPQPSLPMALHRGPDFVKAGQLARSVNFNAHRDAKQRQTGEKN